MTFDIARDIARGLAYLHSHDPPIIHRGMAHSLDHAIHRVYSTTEDRVICLDTPRSHISLSLSSLSLSLSYMHTHVHIHRYKVTERFA
eukprot:TRINITY_DN8882_c1_g1_i1.p1 TRINITY_DN8882_c1_g1~~TRINITY_DN8882_c1_g1_i1.p1  ORF type:complete len:102 (+),score=12.28 TRINITY_DN8882_c1_g1_i1:43-306(+)